MNSLTTKTFCLTDRLGNKLYAKLLFEESSDQQPTTCELFLSIVSENRNRRIGFFDYRDKTLYVSRKQGKHLHIASKSYGFNWAVLNEKVLFKVERIHLTEEETGDTYLFPIEVILQYGRFLHFKKSGTFELQRFLNTNFMTPFKIQKNAKAKATGTEP